MKQFVRFALMFLLLLSGLYITARAVEVSEDPITVYVDNTATFDGEADGSVEKPFEQIQDAINYISGVYEVYEADTVYEVLIGQGDYFESVVISNLSKLSITGAGRDLTTIGPDRAYELSNNGIKIDNAHYITIQDLAIDGASNPSLTGSTFRDGIYFSDNGGNYNTFRNLKIQNIDRRGISVWPLTTVGTLIEDNYINNVTGVEMGSWLGSVGIVLQGLGSVQNNLIENIHTGILASSGSTQGDVRIENNTIQNFKNENIALNTGISVWPKGQQKLFIRNNSITSNAIKQVGMYLNDSWHPDSIVEGNSIVLTGEYSVGLDVLNHRNGSGGYTIQNNTLELGKYSTGISLANVGTSSTNTMIISGNTITNIGDDDDFTNAYTFDYVFDRSELGREVGILISSSILTKRLQDTDTTVAYLTMQSNLIEGFKEAIVYVRDRADTGDLDDIEIVNNTLGQFEQDVVYGILEEVDNQVVFENIELSSDQTFALIQNNHYPARIDFNTNVTGINVDTIHGYDGDSLSLPRPSRTGYSFLGWFDASYTTEFNQAVIPKGITTLHAKWQINSYRVSFVDHLGNLIGTEQTVNHGNGASAPSTPVRQGYSFVGWNQSFSNVTSNMTISTVWSINSYRVSFVDHMGNLIGTEQSVVFGADAIEPSAPSRVGYTFTGWDRSYKAVSSNLTVKALYQAIEEPEIIVESQEVDDIEVSGLEDLEALGIVFTEEELSKTCCVDLKVSLLDVETLNETDKTILENYLEENPKALLEKVCVLDISLFKMVDQQATSITNLKAPVTISFKVPEGYRDMEFELLRIHEGQLELLEYSYDPETFILTFSTDRFSTYALVEASKESEDVTLGIAEITSDDNEKSEVEDQTNPNDYGMWVVLLSGLALIMIGLGFWLKNRVKVS